MHLPNIVANEANKKQDTFFISDFKWCGAKVDKLKVCSLHTVYRKCITFTSEPDLPLSINMF